jgi:hypothetical protein
MAEPAVQNYANHVRLVPLYHQVAFPILAVNLLWSLYQAVRAFSFATVLGAAVAFALLVIFFYARVFALAAQDRLIRLEMRLRMQQLLPPDLKARINEFTVAQLVSLRFASDEELPDLARKVLADNIQDRKSIKKMIRNWQGDYVRV